MIKGTFPIAKFRELETPFYYYDTKVLRDTLAVINKEASKYGNFCVHYAVKANLPLRRSERRNCRICLPPC